MNGQKRKILYLITQSKWGGAQEYVFNLATNLPKDKFDVLVAAGQSHGELFNYLNRAGIKYHQLKWTERSVNPLLDKLALWELIKLFKQEKPDIIHLNSSKIGFLGCVAAKLTKFIT